MCHNAFLVGLVCGLLVLGNSSHAWASEFGPFRGKIVDADTKKPIEGVVVLIEWVQIHPFRGGSSFYDARETLTDNHGEFSIPRIWSINPLVWLRVEAQVWIYKSGYYGLHVPWGALITPWGEPIAGVRKTYVIEVEEDKPIIAMKKLTLVERKQYFTPGTSGIPRMKKKLLIQEINKERMFLGYGEVTD